MKKTIALILTAALILTTVAAIAAEPTTYTRKAVVLGLDWAEDLVTCVDTEGNEWAFYGIEDLALCDLLELTMDTKGTEEIEDDEITALRYLRTLGTREVYEWVMD